MTAFDQLTADHADAPGHRDLNAADSAECVSCGSVHARPWSTPEGTAQLCPPCATLHGFGCP